MIVARVKPRARNRVVECIVADVVWIMLIRLLVVAESAFSGLRVVRIWNCGG